MYMYSDNTKSKKIISLNTCRQYLTINNILHNIDTLETEHVELHKKGIL